MMSLNGRKTLEKSYQVENVFDKVDILPMALEMVAVVRRASASALAVRGGWSNRERLSSRATRIQRDNLTRSLSGCPKSNSF
jgi:hypothetical protein